MSKSGEYVVCLVESEGGPILRSEEPYHTPINAGNRANFLNKIEGRMIDTPYPRWEVIKSIQTPE